MVIAVCSTPLQLINIINMKFNVYMDKKVDLIILNHSKANNIYFEKLIKLDVFNKIIYVDSYLGEQKKGRLKRHLSSILYFLSKSKIENQIFKNASYGTFVMFSTDLPTQIIYNYYKDINSKMELVIVEEGLFTYGIEIFNFSFFKKIIMKLVFNRVFIDEISQVYVYKPDYINSKKFGIKNIPNLSDSHKTVIDTLNEVFVDTQDEKVTLEKIMFFDQPYQSEEIRSEIKNILMELKNLFDRKIQIKLHPRTNTQEYDSDYLKFNSTIPFEIALLNEKIDNKILMSVFSSACIMPKIMFDEEPFVILLYKLIDVSDETAINSDIIDLVYKVKESYKNPERFVIPETFEELTQIIKSYQN